MRFVRSRTDFEPDNDRTDTPATITIDALSFLSFHHIAAPDVAGRIETAATAPVIAADKVEALSAAYDFFADTERSVLDAHFSGHDGLRIITAEVQELFLNSPSYRRLVDSVRELSDEERIDLNALGWLGAGHFPDWQRSVEHAEKMVLSVGPEYTAGYGHCWRTGYRRATEV